MLQQITPWFGYLASLCLIVALLVSNDLQFRWFNTMGNIFFIVYALVLGAVPVLITNALLLGINAYYLIKVYSRQENFDMLAFTGGETMAKKFLQFYKVDIENYFPGFLQNELEGNLNFVVTRDLVIANMFSAAVLPNGDAVVALNYTLKKYRDYKVGTYIFEKEKDYLIAQGVKRIVYKSVHNKNHLRFLKVMGFEKKMGDGKEYWAKELLLR